MIILKLCISSISAYGKWKLICAGLLSFVYICIAFEDPAIKSGEFGIPLLYGVVYFLYSVGYCDS